MKSGLKNGDRRKRTQGGIYCNNIGERCSGAEGLNGENSTRTEQKGIRRGKQK